VFKHFIILPILFFIEFLGTALVFIMLVLREIQRFNQIFKISIDQIKIFKKKIHINQRIS